MITPVAQNAWPWLIAVYLFLGGLGGGVVAIGAFSDLFLQPNNATADRRPALFAGLFGWGALALGSLVLLYDLEQPFKAYLAVRNLRSWISWGVMFISLYMAVVPVYLYPYLRGVKRAPLWQRAAGGLAAILGVLVALYTGFLLASSTGVPFWNPAILPAIFVISGLSTGAAALMLYLMRLAPRSAFAAALLPKLERADIALILLELAGLGVLFGLGATGHPAAKESVRLLGSSVGFLLGVPVAGLLLPLGLESVAARRHRPTLTALAGVLVLVGGALLRVYLLKAGVWGLPWPQ